MGLIQSIKKRLEPSRSTYEQRLEKCKNPLLRKLFGIIVEKKTNLCVAANFGTIEELVEFIDKVGQHICIIKTQTERLRGDIHHNLSLLYAKKKEYNFLIFEDRKFYDGEETVSSVYKQQYVECADLVTVNPMCGDGIFKAIEATAKAANLPEDEPRGCVGVCEVSFSGWLPIDTMKYYRKCIDNLDVCCAIVAQKFKLPVNVQSSLVKMTPGVHMDLKTDGLNQQWNHPAKVVKDCGADIIIVGRGIVSLPKDQWESAAIKYKDEAYKAYLASCESSQ